MVSISGDLLDKQLPILESIPYAACYIEDLKEVHQSLLAYLPKPVVIPLAVQVLQDKARELDLRHDRLYRGCNRLMAAQQEFAETPEEEEALRAMQAHYFPRGDSGTALTYQEEAGAGRILADKLSSEEDPNPQYREMAKQIIARGDKTLFDKLNEVATISLELGEVDTAKIQAVKDAEEATKASAGPSARKVQFEWIDVVKRIFEGLERGHKKGMLSDEDREKVFAQLQRAQETIEKRNAKKAEPPKPAKPAPAPKDPTLPPGSTPESC